MEKEFALKKVFVLAGEASGDLHGAGVINELKKTHPNVHFFGVGGTLLKEAGVACIYQASEISFMGFTEIARHFLFLRRVLRELKRAIKTERPDVALLIDYPGMNLILAKYLKSLGIPVVWYIAPQVWAWKESRVKKMKKSISKLCVVFDFEVGFFKERGLDAAFVGHPIIEELNHSGTAEVNSSLQAFNPEKDQRIIGLLPGSRKQEVDRLLPEMLKAAEILAKEGDYKFLLGLAPTLDPSYYAKFLKSTALPIVQTTAYRVMLQSHLSWITSGTATLEALCFGTPMIVVYKTSPLNYFIGKRLVKIKNIALANIVSQGLNSPKRTVPELLQHEVSGAALAANSREMLQRPEYLREMQAQLLNSRAKLGSRSPSKEVAAYLIKHL
ncbi:MAG: lipid-A-disaccharide synthase [Chloroherpetonaceae bacterium]|nr:lipid-A-disaccharide synthase [Chloroherpetonaceae bacterium]